MRCFAKETGIRWMVDHGLIQNPKGRFPKPHICWISGLRLPQQLLQLSIGPGPYIGFEKGQIQR
jgi:hypothetical protein